MFSFPRKRLIALAAVIGLAACDTADPAKPLPRLTYDHLAAISLAVSRVEVVNRYQAPLRRPNVDHRFDTRPGDALADWARSRIKAVGGPATARFIIEDASAVEERLRLDTSLKGVFKKEQSARYLIRLAGALEILDAGGRRAGNASARVIQGRTTPEDATLNELRTEWFTLIEKGMTAFDKEMEKNVRRFLANWLR